MKLLKILENISTKTIYISPDNEEFDDFDEFTDYMLNDYEVTLDVEMVNDLDDLLHYESEEDIFAGENIDLKDEDAVEEFRDHIEYNWDTYNGDLESRTGVDVNFQEYYFEPKYEITGSINGLLEYCKNQCSHYTLDNPGETLYKEIENLEDFKKSILMYK